MKNVEDILKKQLKAIGAEGLCEKDSLCACFVDTVMGCGDYDRGKKCVPGVSKSIPMFGFEPLLTPVESEGNNE